jgi:hypothetical protein
MDIKVTKKELQLYLEARKKPGYTWKDIVKQITDDPDGIDMNLLNQYKGALRLKRTWFHNG